MRAYEHFLNYVKIHTTSDGESGTHPSFPGEADLGKLLRDELQAIGLCDVILDESCYVYGYLPASEGMENCTPIGLISHMDTAPDAPGENVKPQLCPGYDGGEIRLGDSGLVLDPQRFPFLEKFKGETVITGDGTTLLGADDKAGCAEIITALETIQAEKLPHGPLYIAFTPDEEIGEGTELFDMSRFGAKFAYTVDGGDIDCLEYENFNAASAEIVIRGVSIHPGDAKDVMVNASEAAMEFDALLPKLERPEHTSGREGFYHLTAMSGSVSEAKLSYILRDHDRALFETRKQMVLKAAEELNRKYGEGTASATVEDSYYNMYEKISPYPELIDYAMEAIRGAGLEPSAVAIRGGTDGARLSYMGIPCPNLGTGGYNFHGKYECITAERMDRAVQILVRLIRRFTE